MLPPRVTIFTPTYNRANHLPLLHASLKDQGVPKDTFEWLVVDDGSEDDTPVVLERLSDDDSVQMRYLTKPNGGKHSAINLAAQEANGKWILIIDSDDRLLAQVLGQVLKWLDCVESKKEIGMIRCLQMFPDRYQMPNSFSLQNNPCTHMEWLSCGKGFDTAEIIRSEVLREYPLPEYPGERFMAEIWLWLKIAEKYKTYFVDIAVTYCEYQADGLSSNNDVLRAESSRSAMAVYEMQYNMVSSLKARSSINWWRYYCHALHSKKSCAKLNFYAPKFFLPFGILAYLKDKIL